MCGIHVHYVYLVFTYDKILYLGISSGLVIVLKICPISLVDITWEIAIRKKNNYTIEN